MFATCSTARRWHGVSMAAASSVRLNDTARRSSESSFGSASRRWAASRPASEAHSRWWAAAAAPTPIPVLPQTRQASLADMALSMHERRWLSISDAVQSAPHTKHLSITIPGRSPTAEDCLQLGMTADDEEGRDIAGAMV